MEVAEAAETRATTSRVATLDGLRGAAVVAVVYFHVINGTALLPFPGSGFLGVIVFFVLSGYLITRILWRNQASLGASRYLAFVRRRVIRLYPALLGLLVVGTPLILLLGPEPPSRALPSVLAALFQSNAFVRMADVPLLEGLNPTWSLTVEWTFYLLWPLVLVALGRGGASTRLAQRVAIGLAIVLYVAALPLSNLAFVLLPVANVGVMLAGAALALAHIHRREVGTPEAGRDAPIVNIAFFLLVALVLIPGAGTDHLGYRYLLVPAAVIVTCIILDQRESDRSIARKVLESAPLRALGLASYSIYLWHLPVLWCVFFALPDVPVLARIVVALAVCVPVTWISFHFLERPWLRV